MFTLFVLAAILYCPHNNTIPDERHELINRRRSAAVTSMAKGIEKIATSGVMFQNASFVQSSQVIKTNSVIKHGTTEKLTQMR